MLNFLQNLQSAVFARHSVRSFDGNAIDSAMKSRLESVSTQALEYFNSRNSRIAVVDSIDESSAPSTYGFIGGCRSYMILISSDKSRDERIRAAAAMEICVLEATSLGLGTCWVGGTFKRSSFAELCHLGEGEEIIAIVPCGKPARPRLRDRLMTAVARSQSRKTPDSLFFINDLSTPMPSDFPLFRPLEYVRLAPSSTNSQPWRIIAVDSHTFDLCSSTDNRYTDLDIGIALAHICVAFAPSEVRFSRSEASYPRLITYARCSV